MAQNVNKPDYFSQFKDAPAKDKPDYFSQYDDAPSETFAAPTKTESFVRGAAQGATLDYADEITGGIEGLVNSFKKDTKFSDEYAKSRDESRANFKAAEEANPKTYLSGQLTGGAATALVPGGMVAAAGKAVGGLVKGTGALASIMRAGATAGATGGVLGAVQGSGASEAKDFKGIASDTVKGGGIGGITGGVLGGGLSGVAKLLPGTRNSVSNNLWDKVLGVSVGDDAAEVAGKYFKDPDARNAMVKMANKDTVNEIKQTVVKSITDDVANLRRQAAEEGSRLLTPVDGKMGERVDGLRAKVANSYKPAADSMNGKTGQNLRALVEEVEQILSGNNVAVLKVLGEDIGERLVSAPNAQTMRDVRDAIKKQLFKQGDPGQGVKDSISQTEATTMTKMLKETQLAFKSIPEAAKADSLYAKASQYSQAVESKLYKNGEVSSAAVESWILGKGAAGAVEDKDHIFKLRELVMQEFQDAGVATKNFGKDSVAQARDIQDWNRLGVGENTGRSLGGMTATGVLAQLGFTIGTAGLGGVFAFAATQPRQYLRALAKIESLSADDHKVIKAIFRAMNEGGRRGRNDLAQDKFGDKKD